MVGRLYVTYIIIRQLIYPKPHKVYLQLLIAKQLVVCLSQLMRNGFSYAKGLEVGHWNIKLGEMGYMFLNDPPPMYIGYIMVISRVGIYVFYLSKDVQWKMLVLHKQALWSEG